MFCARLTDFCSKLSEFLKKSKCLKFKLQIYFVSLFFIVRVSWKRYLTYKIVCDKMKDKVKHKKISWKRILLFFIIATIISSIFRFDVFDLKSQVKELPTWIFVSTTVFLEGSGVLLGAFIAITLLKKKRKTEITLFGTSKSKSLIMAIIPLIILSLMGVKNEFQMNVHLYGFMVIIGTFLYCIFEEYGWRGYLQEELKSLKPWKKYILIGFIWYVWHLSFLTQATLGDNLFF